MMKITIPESLSEITLAQYQNYQLVVDEDKDNEWFLMLKMVSEFCDIPLSKAKDIPLNDVQDVMTTINQAFAKKRRFKKRFTLHEVEFGFIPDLESISMGEFVDISSYMGNVEDLNKLMAILYRPITEKTRDLYNIEKYEGSGKYAQELKHMPLDVALEASVFFYHLASELLNAMTESSNPEVMKIMELVRKNLLESGGDGMAAFTRLQTAT